MALKLEPERLFDQYRQSRDLEIDRLLSQYGSSLKDVRELYPQLMEALKPPAISMEPVFFGAQEALEMGVQLDEGWQLKLTPRDTGDYGVSFITPEQWEITEDDLYISPEGTQYTREELEALLRQPLAPDMPEIGWEYLLEPEDVFGAVFPEMDIEEVMSYIEHDPEGFLEDLWKIGRTPEVERLLRMIAPDIAEELMTELFGQAMREMPEEITRYLLPLDVGLEGVHHHLFGAAGYFATWDEAIAHYREKFGVEAPPAFHEPFTYSYRYYEAGVAKTKTETVLFVPMDEMDAAAGIRVLSVPEGLEMPQITFRWEEGDLRIYDKGEVIGGIDPETGDIQVDDKWLLDVQKMYLKEYGRPAEPATGYERIGEWLNKPRLLPLQDRTGKTVGWTYGPSIANVLGVVGAIGSLYYTAVMGVAGIQALAHALSHSQKLGTLFAHVPKSLAQAFHIPQPGKMTLPGERGKLIDVTVVDAARGITAPVYAEPKAHYLTPAQLKMWGQFQNTTAMQELYKSFTAAGKATTSGRFRSTAASLFRIYYAEQQLKTIATQIQKTEAAIQGIKPGEHAKAWLFPRQLEGLKAQQRFLQGEVDGLNTVLRTTLDAILHYRHPDIAMRDAMRKVAGLLTSGQPAAVPPPAPPPTPAPTVPPTPLTQGAPPATERAISQAVEALARQGLTPDAVTASFVAMFVPPGQTLSVTPLVIQELTRLGLSTEAITALSPEEAWATVIQGGLITEPAPIETALGKIQAQDPDFIVPVGGDIGLGVKDPETIMPPPKDVGTLVTISVYREGVGWVQEKINVIQLEDGEWVKFVTPDGKEVVGQVSGGLKYQRPDRPSAEGGQQGYVIFEQKPPSGTTARDLGTFAEKARCMDYPASNKYMILPTAPTAPPTEDLAPLMAIRPTEEIIDGLIIPNWMRTAAHVAGKIQPVRKFEETVLGWRMFVNRESEAVQDVVGRGATAYYAIKRMGQNMGRLEAGTLTRIIPDSIKFFGFDKSGFSSKMLGRLLPEYKGEREIAGTMEHVLLYPEKYDWSKMGKGLEYVARFNKLTDAVTAMLKAEGVPPREVHERYLHRLVTGRTVEGEEVQAVRRGVGVGATPAYEKPRRFETMAGGIQEGFNYDARPEHSIQAYIEEAYSKIAGERFKQYVEAYGETPTERLMERYPEVAKRAEATKTQLADAARFQSLVRRAKRGEKLPEQTLRAIERRFPEHGKRLRALVEHPQDAEKQLRELLKQNERYIKDLKAQLEKARTAPPAAPPVTPLAPKAEVKVVRITEITQHVETKYGTIPEDTEFQSRWRGLEALDEGTATPSDLDKYLSKLKPERVKQEIEVIEVAIGDEMGDLIETYRYESLEDGQGLEQYLDSLLQVTHKHRAALGMPATVDLKIPVLTAKPPEIPKPAEMPRVEVPDEEKLREAFKLMEYEDRLAFRTTMDTQLQEIGEMAGYHQAEIEGLQDWLAGDAVARYTGKEVSYTTRKGKRIVRRYDITHVLTEGKMPETITPAKAQYLLMGRELKPGAFDKEGNVRPEYVIDELAEYFKMSEQDLIKRIELIAEQKQRLADLQYLARDVERREKQIRRMLEVLANVEGDPAQVKVVEPMAVAPTAPAVEPTGMLRSASEGLKSEYSIYLQGRNLRGLAEKYLNPLAEAGIDTAPMWARYDEAKRLMSQPAAEGVTAKQRALAHKQQWDAFADSLVTPQEGVLTGEPTIEQAISNPNRFRVTRMEFADPSRALNIRASLGKGEYFGFGKQDLQRAFAYEEDLALEEARTLPMGDLRFTEFVVQPRNPLIIETDQQLNDIVRQVFGEKFPTYRLRTRTHNPEIANWARAQGHDAIILKVQDMSLGNKEYFGTDQVLLLDPNVPKSTVPAPPQEGVPAAPPTTPQGLATQPPFPEVRPEAPVIEPTDRAAVDQIIAGQNLDAAASDFAINTLHRAGLTGAQVQDALRIADAIRQLANKPKIGIEELGEAIQYASGGGLAAVRANLEKLHKAATGEEAKNLKGALDRVKAVEAAMPGVAPAEVPQIRDVAGFKVEMLPSELSHHDIDRMIGEVVKQAPSYPKLEQAYVRFIKDLHGRSKEEILSGIEGKEGDLLTAHAGVMDAKSARAKTLKRLADDVFRETGLPRRPEGKFRGEDSVDTEAFRKARGIEVVRQDPQIGPIYKAIRPEHQVGAPEAPYGGAQFQLLGTPSRKDAEVAEAALTKAGIEFESIMLPSGAVHGGAYFSIGPKHAVDWHKAVDALYDAKLLATRPPRPEWMTKIPEPVAGWPEPGLQTDMFGYTVPVQPKGKGRIVQISLDDHKKMVELYQEQGLPLPYTVVKPKIEGISELSDDTVIGKVSWDLPPTMTAADRKEAFDALSKEVNAMVEGAKGPYWKARAERAHAMDIVRRPGIGENYLFMPFAGGRIYDQDFVDSCNKFFGHEAGLSALKFTSDLAGIMRITKAAVDKSEVMIQGLPMLGLATSYMVTNPKIGMKLMGGWMRAAALSSWVFLHPSSFYDYLDKHHDSIAQRIVGFGGSSRAVDYFDVLKAEHGLAKVGAWAMGKVPLKPYHRANIAFHALSEMLQDMGWRALSPKAIKQGKGWELSAELAKATGLGDPKASGVPLTWRQVESSFMWFAPGYTRAGLGLLADVFRGGYTGEFARRALGGLALAMLVGYVGTRYTLGQLQGESEEESWEGVKEGMGIREDPITGEVEWRPRADFMSIQIGNYNFAPGSFWYGFIRLIGNISECINEYGERERIDLVRILKNGGINRDNPFVYWWYSRASPLVGTGMELYTGKTFLGWPIETPAQYAEYIASRFVPIWVERGLMPFIPGLTLTQDMPEGAARAALPVFALYGWRNFPDGSWTQFYDQAREYIKQFPREELDEKQMDAWEAGKLGWGELTAKQKQDLLDRYPDLAELYDIARQDSKLRQSDDWKRYTERIDEERAIYYERIDDLTQRLKDGELDTRTYRQLAAQAGQNYGSIMEAMQRDPTYKSIYDYFEKKQAEGDKYEFYWDMALAEYNTRIRFADDPEMYTATGDYNYAERDRRIDQFIETWGEDIYHEIRDYIAKDREVKGLNQVWVTRGEHTDLLGRTYWRLPYKPIYQMDEDDYEQGNIPAEHYGLWREYQSLPDAEREGFLEQHPELMKDWRAEYRRNNPEHDAMLALWGYSGKIQSMEAYNKVVAWSRELGIPLAQMGLGLPPPSMIEPYFAYNELLTTYSPLSPEVKLWRLENEGFHQWAQENWGWKPIDEDIEALRLKVKMRALDPESAEYKSLERELKAYEKGVPEAHLDNYLKYQDIPTAGYERQWFLQENPDFYRAMVNEGVMGEVDFAKVPTREVWGKYQVYQGLPLGNARLDYRAKNLDLDAWLVIAKGLKPIGDRGDTTTEKTPEEEAAEVEYFKSLFG